MVQGKILINDQEIAVTMKRDPSENKKSISSMDGVVEKAHE